MRRSRQLPALILVVGLFATSGASCPRVVQQYANPLPRALPPSPTLDQVIQAVNNNSTRIESFAANQATLSGEGFPTLRAVVAFERPRRFRLRAQTALTGPEVDLGSNEELFWFWVRRNSPPALYYCRYDQFANSPARQTVAVDPEWLIEAVGLAQFDPRLPHQGPYPVGADRVQIRTIRETPGGPQMKVTVVDTQRGYVLEQHVYDSQNRLVASAVASDHRRDPLTGLMMPRVIAIRSVPAGLSMRIDLGNVEINRFRNSNPEFWSLPNYPGFPAVDLCDPRLQLTNGR